MRKCQSRRPVGSIERRQVGELIGGFLVAGVLLLVPVREPIVEVARGRLMVGSESRMKLMTKNVHGQGFIGRGVGHSVGRIP